MDNADNRDDEDADAREVPLGRAEGEHADEAVEAALAARHRQQVEVDVDAPLECADDRPRLELGDHDENAKEDVVDGDDGGERVEDVEYARNAADDEQQARDGREDAERARRVLGGPLAKLCAARKRKIMLIWGVLNRELRRERPSQEASSDVGIYFLMLESYFYFLMLESTF